MSTNENKRMIWAGFPKSGDFSALEDYLLLPAIIKTSFGRMLIYGDRDGLYVAHYDGETSSSHRREIYILPEEDEQRKTNISKHLRESGYVRRLTRRGGNSDIHFIPSSSHSDGSVAPGDNMDPHERILSHIKFYREKNRKWPYASEVRLYLCMTYHVFSKLLKDLEESGQLTLTKLRGNAIICKLVDRDHS